MTSDRRATDRRGGTSMDRLAIRHGFVLMLLALLQGVLPPFMVNPRLGVGAHTLGMLGGLVLIAIGATKPVFVLNRREWLALHTSWFIAAYANWANTTLAGLTGSSYLTPIAGAGTTGTVLAERFVFWIYVVVGVTSVLGTAIAVYGLLRRDRREGRDRRGG
jgi:(hydroxyamino)benzene mutase